MSEKEEALYQVFDQNQRGDKAREHQVIVKVYETGEAETKTYPLWSEKPTLMPVNHAMQLLVDPAFKVLNPAGKRIQPVKKLDLSKPITVLADDEIVAKYEELSNDSLYRNVKLLPGTELISETDREAMVAFLIGWRKSKKGVTEGQQAIAAMAAQGGLDGQVSEAQLEQMFPKQKAA